MVRLIVGKFVVGRSCHALRYSGQAEENDNKHEIEHRNIYATIIIYV
jgi:hypothetical protein